MPKNTIQIGSPAKLNLCLDVLAKSQEGYHKIQTIYHATSQISDQINILESEQEDDLSISQPPNKQDPFPSENNLAFKALKLLKKTHKVHKTASIQITKNIPYSSGLGGASSNAASTLMALNQLWDLQLTQSQLLDLAKQLGMDVPFFILGGTALGTNYGEAVTALPPLPACIQITIQPKSATTTTTTDATSKTAEAYSSLDLALCGQNQAKTETFIAALHDHDPQSPQKTASILLAKLHNDFEQLYQIPADHHLSGSGPSTFTVKLT